jgi:hypothetical protein
MVKVVKITCEHTDEEELTLSFSHQLVNERVNILLPSATKLHGSTRRTRPTEREWGGRERAREREREREKLYMHPGLKKVLAYTLDTFSSKNAKFNIMRCSEEFGVGCSVTMETLAAATKPHLLTVYSTSMALPTLTLTATAVQSVLPLIWRNQEYTHTWISGSIYCVFSLFLYEVHGL